MSAVLARTVALMEQAAGTERELAGTLQAMTAHNGSEAAARRLKLAQEANVGAKLAVARGERLLRVAARCAEHADVIRLHELLAHAGAVLADLARTQQQIAATLTHLASRDDPELAAERLRAADQAALHAQRAREQIQALRQLAEGPAGQAPQ